MHGQFRNGSGNRTENLSLRKHEPTIVVGKQDRSSHAYQTIRKHRVLRHSGSRVGRRRSDGEHGGG